MDRPIAGMRPGLKNNRLSIVVPVYNEEANVHPLVEGLIQVLRALEREFELLVVDDGSSDGTPGILRSLTLEVPELVAICLRRNFGQTAALQAGFDAARGEIIVTLDGDLQNDPRDIPLLVERIEAGADVVSGWRRDRQDTLVLRKVPSWVANRLIQRMTRVPVHDQGCSLKAYRRQVIQGLDLYSDMHRFVVVLTMPLGARIEEVVVRHHARVAGESKYGISRVFKVLADLLTIKMLTTFRQRPSRWFAWIGLPFLVLAVLFSMISLWSWQDSLIPPTIAFYTTTLFVWCLLAGALGEAVLDGRSNRSWVLTGRKGARR